MPITRAQVEQVLVRQYGAKFRLVGLDGTTTDGTNADLDTPIAQALASLRIFPATLLGVADSDLAAVAAGDVAQLLAVAGLVCLETVLSNWTQPDQMADVDNQQDLGALYNSWEKTATRLRAQIEKQYGVGRGGLSAGTLDLGFDETLPGWITGECR